MSVGKRWTKEEYKSIMTALVKRYVPEKEDYFIGHFPRFWAQVQMLDKHIHLNRSAKVLDCGTYFPFASYYLYHKFGCEVTFCDLETKQITVNDKVKNFRSNICYDDYGTAVYDVVFLTEVLEHLPCNMLKARDKILKSIKPDGWLLASYPLKGANATNYDADLPGDWETAHYSHIREFTQETADSFIAGLPVVEKNVTYTTEYAGNIYQILYKKSASKDIGSNVPKRTAKLRVGWVSPSPLLPTGIGKVAQHLIAGLVSKGNEVFVSNPQYAGKPIIIEGATHYPLFDDFSLIENFLDDIKPDVMVSYGSNWAPPYNQISPICVRKGIKLLWYTTIEFQSLSLVYLQSLIGTTRVVTTSKYARGILAKNHIDAGVVPHGCDFSIYHPIKPKPRFEGAEGKFVFGMIARNQLRKEYPILMRAFTLLPEKVKENSMLYLHTMPFEETQGKTGWRLPEMILRMGLQGKVIMPTKKGGSKWWGQNEEELAKTYNVLGCHVLCSSGEGFGIPILESSACRIPQIASNNTAIPEVMGDGGLLIDCQEDEVWTAENLIISTTKIGSTRDQMLRMFEDHELREELSRKALAHSREFTWEKAVNLMADAIEETYETESRLGNEIFKFEEPIEASVLSEIFIDYIPKGSGKALDIGCGKDHPYKKEFENKGYEYTGVDIKGNGKGVLRLDATKPLPFADKEFNFAFGNQFLEHIATEKQLAVVAEAKRVAEKGVFIFPLESNITFWLDPAHHKVDARIKEQGNYIEENENGVLTWG